MPPTIGSWSAKTPVRPLLSGLLGICSARHLAILWQNRHDRHMTQTFSSMTAALLLTITSSTWAQPASAPRSDHPSGNDLLTQASSRLAAEPSIAADLRYRIDAYGHEL